MASFSLTRPSPHRLRRDEDGYILLTLLLVVALMAITAAAVLPTISFEIKRDREQEMIHRGVQYSRAIRAYYKKFGRYPTRLEDLDNTSNLRFLRKHYKDPLNKNQDFRLLHYGEQGVTLAGGIAGGSIPGATPTGSPAGLNGSGPSSSGFGGGLAGSGLSNTGVNNSGAFSQSSGLGGNSNSGFGASSSSQTPPGQQATTAAPGSDPTPASSQIVPGTAQGDVSSSGQQLAVGGPIVGVASVSKKDTIREFNHKKKYNEWQFVYDPATDRGGLITTPSQPALASFGSQPGLGTPAGQMGQGTQPGTTGSTNGSSFGNSFGQPTGLSNNPNPLGGPTPPAQPPSNPPPNPPQQQ